MIHHQRGYPIRGPPPQGPARPHGAPMTPRSKRSYASIFYHRFPLIWRFRMKTPTHALVSDTPDISHPSDVFTVAEVAQLLRVYVDTLARCLHKPSYVGHIFRRKCPHNWVDATTVRRWITHGALEAICFPRRGLRQAYRVKGETLETLLGEPRSSRPSQ